MYTHTSMHTCAHTHKHAHPHTGEDGGWGIREQCFDLLVNDEKIWKVIIKYSLKTYSCNLVPV